MLDVVPCESCAGPTELAMELESTGAAPGHRVFFCEDCRRYTWRTWRVVQQQQQSQPQK